MCHAKTARWGQASPTNNNGGSLGTDEPYRECIMQREKKVGLVKNLQSS
jgi:hypothetical protein